MKTGPSGRAGYLGSDRPRLLFAGEGVCCFGPRTFSHWSGRGEPGPTPLALSSRSLILPPSKSVPRGCNGPQKRYIPANTTAAPRTT